MCGGEGRGRGCVVWEGRGSMWLGGGEDSTWYAPPPPPQHHAVARVSTAAFLSSATYFMRASGSGPGPPCMFEWRPGYAEFPEHQQQYHLPVPGTGSPYLRLREVITTHWKCTGGAVSFTPGCILHSE